MRKHRLEDLGSLLGKSALEAETFLTRRRWLRKTWRKSSKDALVRGAWSGEAVRPGLHGWGLQKGDGAGGEVREACRSQTTWGWWKKNFIFTPKAVKATEGFWAGKSCDLIYIKNIVISWGDGIWWPRKPKIFTLTIYRKSLLTSDLDCNKEEEKWKR